MLFLGLDTSNYTTSVALYDSTTNKIYQQKMLLPVKPGELGIRQSDAVFHHTKQLPVIVRKLFSDKDFNNFSAIGVSSRPRNIDTSYMPCFLVGNSMAETLSIIDNTELYVTSHQVGHVLAALYSADKLDLIQEKFIAFHVSGGTTDCLLVEKDDENLISIKTLSTSLDLKAGQAVDRVGLMLGLSFPCGKELEKLALTSTKEYKIKPCIKNGCCSLSGIENRCRKMFDDKEPYGNIAKFCLMSIYSAVSGMTEWALKDAGDIPVVFAGGVMSNSLIRERLSGKFDSYFAEPDFSCDNAAGVALYAYLCHKRKESSI